MKNKPNIVVIGICPEKTLVQQLIKHAECADVIIIDNKETQKENPFESPPIPIKKYNIEQLREPYIKPLLENNPYPSPKGRRGKKRY